MNVSVILGLKVQIYFMISNQKKKPPKWVLSILQNRNKIETGIKSDEKIKIWKKYEKGLKRLNTFVQLILTISSQAWFLNTVLNAPPVGHPGLDG